MGTWNLTENAETSEMINYLNSTSGPMADIEYFNSHIKQKGISIYVKFYGNCERPYRFVVIKVKINASHLAPHKLYH